MFCRVCGQQVYDNAVVCQNCGYDPRNGVNFCPNCGLYCGSNLARTAVPVPEKFYQTVPLKHKHKKIPALLLAFFFGGLGLHCFYLGNSGKGITMLLITLFGSVVLIGPLITLVWALLDFIRILFMSSQSFERFVEEQTW